MQGDLLLRRAWVADGTGAPMRKCDCLIEQGKILALEKDLPCSAAEHCVDLGGMILGPGFIDAHGHSDLSLLSNPEGFSKLSQGITTEICGNCGLSPFPLTPENREHLEELYADYGVKLDWRDRAEYLTHVRNCAVTPVPLCGHNTLRAAVMGYEAKEATSEQVRKMTELLDSAMKQGAPGLSFGLLYVPGINATTEEITALMAVVAKHDGIVTAHLRSEGEKLLESIEEMAECAFKAKLKRFHISHLKTAGRANWSKLPALYALLEEWRAKGLEITCDRYPYTESMTQLSVALPGEWKRLNDSDIMRKLQKTEERLLALNDLRQAKEESYWKSCRLVDTKAAKYQAYRGKFLSEISSDPAELAIELLSQDAVNTTAAFGTMSEDNMLSIISQTWCAAGSDGNALPTNGKKRPHPRSFGALAKFLHLRLEQGAKIEETVYQLTGLPAQIFRLDCGKIEVGRAADLTAFDPDTVDSKADFAAPETPAQGILYVWKNAVLLFKGE